MGWAGGLRQQGARNVSGRSEFPFGTFTATVRTPVLLNISPVQKAIQERDRGLYGNHPSKGSGAERKGGRGWRQRARGLRKPRDTLGERGAGDRGGGRRRTPHLGMPGRRLLPGLGPRRLLPPGSHGLAAGLFALLLLHAGCPVRRELLATDARSLLRGQIRKPRLSRSKNDRLAFPRRQPHKLGQTPPTSGSVRRLHAAQAQRAGAHGTRASVPTGAGGGGRGEGGARGWEVGLRVPTRGCAASR